MDQNAAQKFGVATREQIERLTGRQHLEEIIRGFLPAPPIAQTLSFSLIEVSDGFVAFEGNPGPHLLNPLGTVHGGWVLTLIDSVTGCAVHSTLPAGVAYTTIETKANFSRPITPNTGVVRAEGRVVGKGRTIISAEGRVFDDSGRLLAHGTSTLMVLKPENRGTG
jgi:uncharacterized protein (TIGR00369 family)